MLILLPDTCAQRTIYAADFSVDGATSGNNWRVLASTGCDPGASIFAAQGGAFVINDMEGSGCTGNEGGNNDNIMQIGPVNVFGAGCLEVNYLVDAVSGSGFEIGAPGGDLLKVTTIVDGTTFNAQVFQANGQIINIGQKRIPIPFSANTVSILIEGGTQSKDEVFSVSGVSILDVSYTPSIPDFPVCKDELFNLNQLTPGIGGVWFGTGVTANQWATFNLEAGETYELTFDPADACGASVTVDATVIGGSPAGSGTLASCSTTNTAVFDLTQADEDILDGANGNVVWFRDENKQNPILNPTAYPAEDGDLAYGAYLDGENCVSEAGMITLRIQDPAPPERVDDVEACGSYTLPVLRAGLRYDGRSAGDVITSDATIMIETGSGACIASTSYNVRILPVPTFDPYTGATEACDSLLLPAITGNNLSNDPAYFSERGGNGTRYEAGEYYKEIGQQYVYRYDENGVCTVEDSVLLDLSEQAILNLRDTIVCDTFAFLPYTGPGTFQGYYSELNGGGTEYQPGEGIKRDPGTLRIYARAGVGNCIAEDSFDITFQLAPDLVTISVFQDCDTFRLPEIGGDNLSGNQGYYLMPGGQGSRIPAGTLLEETTTLYVYDRIGSCPDELILPVIIIPRPQLAPVQDTVVCDTLILPDIIGNRLSGAQAYWTEPGGVGTVYDPGGLITSSQKLYLYDEQAGCNAQDSFTVTVNTRPRITAPIGEWYLCDTFTLPPITGNPLLGDEVITTLPRGQGDTLLAGTRFADSAILYLYGGVESCRMEDSLQLFINTQPVLFPQSDIDTCDYWVLPPIRGENLTANAAYYDAPEGLGEAYFPGDTLSESGTYYVYDFTEVGCIAADTFEVQIGITPQLMTINDTLACSSFILPPVTGQNLQAPAYLNDPFVPTQFFTEGQELTGDQRIYIYDADRSCIDTTSFSVRVLPQVSLETTWRDTMVCDAFVLEPIQGQNLTGNEGYFEAPDGQGNRYFPGDVMVDSIRLFVYDGRETCTDQDTLDIYVAPTPQLDPMADVSVCDFYVLPGLSGQNLTAAAAYFDVNSGERFIAGDTLFTNHLLEAVDANAFACRSVQSFQVLITPTPSLAAVEDQEVCDQLVLPVIGGQFLPTTTSYFTDTLGSGFRLNTGTPIAVSQKIYVLADSMGCRDEASFAISVDYTPQVRNALPDTTACYEIELPMLSGRDLSPNTAYYDQPEGMGNRIDLPLTIQSDTILYLFGNNGNCYLRDTIEIAVNQLSVDLLISDSIDCFGDLGQIELQNLSAKQPVDIRWSDPAFNGNTILTNLPAGRYELTLTDPDNCSLDTSINLTQPDSLVLNCTILQQVTVPNGRDGQLEWSISGGTAPYRLFLSGDIRDTLSLDSPADLRLDTLPAGTYTLTLVDQLGCTQICSQTITAPPCTLELAVQATDISCAGADDGSIVVQVNNAQDPLQINWTDAALGDLLSLENLEAGTYALTVTDVNACTDSAAVTILDPAPLQLFATALQAVSSNTANDGVAGLTFSGGTAPYQLVYDGPQRDTLDITNPGSLNVDSLRQGVYIFEIIDANNCRVSATLTITNPNCGMQVDLAKVDQQCPNTVDGALRAIVTGGLAPYQYVWQDGNRDSIRNDLPAGIYRLTVLDRENCVTEVSDTIEVAHALPDLSLMGDTIRCDTACQSFELALSGTAPFNFSWNMTRSLAGQDSTISGVVGGVNGTNEVLTFCESGERLELRVNTLEDAHCRVRLDTSFVLNILPVPMILVSDTLCQDEFRIIEGQRFDQNNPSDTIRLMNLAMNGCDSLIFVDLTFLPTVYDTLREVICREDSLVVNGTTYNFGNAAGTETFTGQSATGCDSVLYVDLSFYEVDTNYVRETRCDQDSMILAGRVFDVNHPVGTVVLPNAAATGCDSIIDVMIDFVPRFTTDLMQSICPEDSLLVNGTRYDRFRLSGTEMFRTAAGCDSIVNIDLRLRPADTNRIQQALCPGDSLVVNGRVYHENNLQGLQVLESAAANGCDSLIEVSLTYFPEIRTLYQDTLCYLDTLEVNGVEYHNTNTQGTAIFVGQGVNGCDSIVEIDLYFRAPITAQLLGNTAICVGNSAELSLALSGAERYNLVYQAGNNTPVSLSGLSDGARFSVQPELTTRYQLVSVWDADSGCVGTPFGETATITVSEITLSLVQGQDYNGFGVSCNDASDGVLLAEADGGVAPYTYHWSNGGTGPRLDGLSADDYGLTVTDEAGCRDSMSQLLMEPEPLQLSTTFTASKCATHPNGIIRITDISGGVMPYQYKLEGTIFQDIDALPWVQGGLAAGSYDLQIRDDNGCLSTTPVQILEDNLRIDFDGDLSLTVGDSVRLEPEANFDLVDFSWQPLHDLSDARSVNPFVSPERTRAYTITAVDTSGCQVSASVMVFVDQNRKVFAPSAFTPNEDGVNDRFTLFGDEDLERIEVLQIYDRWGNLLYEENQLAPSDDHVGWTGEYRGEVLPGGLYIYRALVRFSNGDEQEVKGEVLLLR
jgi:gliding motility-associated-like protein